MIAVDLSQNAPNNSPSKRVFAQFSRWIALGFRDSDGPCTFISSAGGSSKLPVVFCQHRYPSPCRSVPTQNRPAYLRFGGFPDLATNRYMWFKQLELTVDIVNLTGGNTKQKGNLTCLRKLGSSRQLQHLDLLAVLKQIANVRWLAQVLAVSLAKQSVTTIVSKARLRAGLLVRCRATSLAAKTTQNLRNFERRRGQIPAAFSV